MATKGAHPMRTHESPSTLATPTPEGHSYVGGCHGWFVVPDSQLAEFNRGTGYVAVLGVALLLVFALIRFTL